MNWGGSGGHTHRSMGTTHPVEEETKYLYLVISSFFSKYSETTCNDSEKLMNYIE